MNTSVLPMDNSDSRDDASSFSDIEPTTVSAGKTKSWTTRRVLDWIIRYANDPWLDYSDWMDGLVMYTPRPNMKNWHCSLVNGWIGVIRLSDLYVHEKEEKSIYRYRWTAGTIPYFFRHIQLFSTCSMKSTDTRGIDSSLTRMTYVYISRYFFLCDQVFAYLLT